LWDLILGDPPNHLHPVCLVGNEISWLWKRRPGSRRYLLGWGFLLVAAVILPPLTLGGLVMALPLWAAIILGIPLFKASFSLSGLFKASREIQRALKADDLAEARRLTGWHLVSRDTSDLTESEITGCVIESVAENLTDSLISPFFWFLLAGLPGAWFCRSVNMCDAMIGYRHGDYEWGGKFAARLDDLIHWLPARFTALLICFSAFITKGSSGQTAWQTMVRDRRKTDSPNAGWTMAAAAGALGVVLSKKGQYTLGEGGRECALADLEPMFGLLRNSALSGSLLFLIISGGLLWLL
jgi:adenosylcobinamide-phosphate synthase